ncbi:MAG: septum formation initiator family protein [Chloroflexota bacterium]
MQILLLLVLTVSLYFAAAFTNEMLDAQQIDHQVTALDANITLLRARNQELQAKVRDAQTAAFAEREARDKLGLIKPGDVPVIVVNVPTPQPAPTPAPAPSPPHWEQWKTLLLSGQ